MAHLGACFKSRSLKMRDSKALRPAFTTRVHDLFHALLPHMPRTTSSKEPGGDLAPESGTRQASPSFEKALEELETIVVRMEDGSLSLDQSLASYQRGAELVKICETALERAKEQVRVLDGELLRPLSEMPVRGSDRE